jgi:hypothetical protein
MTHPLGEAGYSSVFHHVEISQLPELLKQGHCLAAQR